MVKILYGSGLRAIECIRLRVKDLDFGMNQIIVRDGKGKKAPWTSGRDPGGHVLFTFKFTYVSYFERH